MSLFQFNGTSSMADIWRPAPIPPELPQSGCRLRNLIALNDRLAAQRARTSTTFGHCFCAFAARSITSISQDMESVAKVLAGE
jgi:hypothetical protein